MSVSREEFRNIAMVLEKMVQIIDDLSDNQKKLVKNQKEIETQLSELIVLMNNDNDLQQKKNKLNKLLNDLQTNSIQTNKKPTKKSFLKRLFTVPTN